MPTYLVDSIIRDEAFPIEIPEAEYHTLRDARNGMLAGLSLEEKFGYVIANLRQFELSLIMRSLDSIFTAYFDWSAGISRVQEAALALVNLMTSCRLYLDHTLCELSEVFGKPSPQYDAVRQSTHDEYDQHASYRIMESLRNVVQHRSIPVHGMTEKGGWDGPHCEHQCELQLDREALLKDDRVKPIVKEDLTKLNAHFDVRPLVREYVESLARVHETLQEACKQHFADCDRRVRECVEACTSAIGKKPHIRIVVQNDADETVERFDLFTDPARRRQELSHARLACKFLARHFVSNRLVPSRDVDRSVGPLKSC